VAETVNQFSLRAAYYSRGVLRFPDSPAHRPRLLALGDLALDIVVTPAAAIATGSDTPGSIQFRIGGSAANTARAFAGLGGVAEFIGAVGDEGVGRRLRDALRASGVGDRVRSVAGKASARLIVQLGADGQRSFVTMRGAADDLRASDIERAWFQGADVLHLPAYSLLNRPLCEAAVAAAEYAHVEGGLVSVDLASAEPLRQAGAEAAWQAIASVHPDIIFTNEDEAEALDRPLGELAPLVVTKLGAMGCRVVRRGVERQIGADREIMVPAQPVAASDTTGAGDAFDAGFLYAMVGQPSAGPGHWADAGNNAAATLLGTGRPELEL
jgi:sugar/nucleoside kinase (ribokinase family)